MVDLIKFIHLLSTLAVIGLVTLGTVVVVKSSKEVAGALLKLNKLTMYGVLVAMLTGTLLVYPKGFTYHTPWIQAAYCLLFLFGGLVALLNRIIKKKPGSTPFFAPILYALLLIILLFVIHDAVTKTTFLFNGV